jgi:hypothetical protein
MSTGKTFLVLVFSDWNPNWREDFLIFDEEDGVRIVADAGIAPFPWKRERCLFFEIQQPLTQEQVRILEENKQLGIFKSFSIQNEMIHE